jgi:hypothetical protein
VQRQIVCGGIPIKLPPRELAFYAWHAQRHLSLQEGARIGWKDTLGEHNALMVEYFLTYWEVLHKDELNPDYLEARRAFAAGFGKDDWAGIVHHLNKSIRSALGATHGEKFEIKSSRVGGVSNLRHYGVDYPRERIMFLADKAREK